MEFGRIHNSIGALAFLPVLLVAAVFVSIPGALFAGELTRAQVIAETLSRNPELRARREQLGVSEADLLRARRVLPANPTLEGEYASDALLDNSGDRRLGFGISQRVEIAGQRGLRVNSTELRLREARSRLRALELRVARDAADAYYALWRAEKMRALARSTLEVNRSFQKVAESRFRVGDIAELERNVVDIDVARAEAAAVAADAESQRARAELSRLTGRSADEEFAVAEEALPALPQVDLPRVRDLATSNRAELAAARLAEQAAATELSLRYREIVPNPTLSLSYGREQVSVSGTLPMMGDVRLDHVATLILGKLSLPIPVWDRNQAEIRAAQATRGFARAERQGVEAAINAEVQAAVGAVQSAHRAVELYESALPRVDRNLALLDQAYQVGQVDLSELLAAKDRAFVTRREHIDARASYGKAVNELMRATGRLPSGETR